MMIEKGQKLPFDISQYGVIEYDDKITAATIFEESLQKFIDKIELEKPIDSPALDFPEIQKKNRIIKQTEVDLNKAYEDKLEKIYELIVKLQEDKAFSTTTSKGATKYDIRNTKILWVDDNPSNNEAIMDVYRLQGVWFDLALNTSQALDLLASNEYNLIISDMGRGQERDAGLKLIRQIKAQYSSFPPIFIFASHRAIEKFGEEAKKEGARLVTSSLQEMILNMNKVLYDKALVS
jgi:CheY-like chemotaxis protein